MCQRLEEILHKGMPITCKSMKRCSIHQSAKFKLKPQLNAILYPSDAEFSKF